MHIERSNNRLEHDKYWGNVTERVSSSTKEGVLDERFTNLHNRVLRNYFVQETEMGHLFAKKRQPIAVSLYCQSAKYSKGRLGSQRKMMTSHLQSTLLCSEYFRKQLTPKFPTKANRMNGRDIDPEISSWICSPEDNLAITNHFKIIATNTQGGTIGKILTQAKVIIIGERHLMKSDQLNIAKIVNAFNSSGIQVLLEGNMSPEFWNILPQIQNRQLLTQAKLWDSQGAISSYADFCSEVLCPILYEGLSLLQIWSQISHQHAIDLKAAQFLVKLDPMTEIIDNKYMITRDTFKRASSAWTEKYEKTLELKNQIIESAFLERNVSMLKTIEKEVEIGTNRIILITGVGHLNSSTKKKGAVEYLFNKMMESSFTYAILIPKEVLKKQNPEGIERDIIQRAREDMIALKGIVYSLAEIDSIIEELQTNYETGNAFSSANLDFDLVRILLPILTLEQM